ncbi:MAG: PAS domain-containing protein [Deltaproteobacteria bacterium]|nr:PAS domain-containing protein [Deltaproteobacteria bacterium]
MVSKPTYDELEQRMQKCTDMLAKTTDKLERETEDCRLVEEVLRDREARARALLNAPTESALLIDSEGVIIALNETAHKRLGKSSDKLVGANVYDLVSPDVGKARKAQADKVIRSGEPVRFEDERQGRWFDQSIYPVFSAHGEVYQLALFAHDITDRKLART